MSLRPLCSALPARPLLLALALCGPLSACNTAPTPMSRPLPSAGTPTTTTPAPTPPAAPQPAPTLALGLDTLTLSDGEERSVPVQVSRVADRVEVTGAPTGLSANMSGNELHLRASGAAPGRAVLTVTGFWGNEQKRASVEVTVLAPVTVAPPATPAPDFSLSLSRSALSLVSGQRSSLPVNVTPNAAMTENVKLAVTAAPSDLAVSISNGILLVDATQTPAGTYAVTVSGTAAGLTRQATVQVSVSPAPAQVSGVELKASRPALQAGQSLDLQATVSGSGAYQTGVSWDVKSDTPGLTAQLNDRSNGSAGLSVPVSAPGGVLTVTARSVQDPTRQAQVQIPVQAAPQPQTVELTVPAAGVSLVSGASAVLAYQGPVRGVSLVQPSALVSRVEMQQTSAQSGQVVLTAGTQAGSGSVSLAFELADGSRLTRNVPVTVQVPAAPPQTPPTPTPPAPTPPVPAPPTGPSGYTWYPESDRAASADELEILRLTNEARARGATCGTTPYAPAPALRWNDQLAHASRNHTLDMGKRGYFDHTTPEGVPFSDRITGAGYLWRTAGENIAAGQPSPAAVVDGWLKSPGHCTNIMNPAFTELGVGAVTVAGSPYRLYWGQNFGTPR